MARIDHSWLMGAEVSSVSVSVSTASAPLVRHVGSALSRTHVPTTDVEAVKEALRAALRTAPVPELKGFLADRGADTSACVEKADLIRAAVPLLLALAREPSDRQRQPPPHRPAGGVAAAGPSAASPRARRAGPAHSGKCKLCKGAIQPSDKLMRVTIPKGSGTSSAGRRHEQQAICHAACVRCSHPGCTASQQELRFRDGKIFCPTHFDLRFAPRCGECDEPITGAYVTAGKTKYHPECFVCCGCRKPLADSSQPGAATGSYTTGEDGLPYCRPCFKELFAPRCAACAVVRPCHLRSAFCRLSVGCSVG